MGIKKPKSEVRSIAEMLALYGAALVVIMAVIGGMAMIMQHYDPMNGKPRTECAK